MKCKRCGATLKKGEIYCDKCGEKNKIDDTIDIGVLKGNDNQDDDEVFYNKQLESSTNPVNVVLFILVLLLLGGFLYFAFFSESRLINKDTSTNTIDDKEQDKTIYFEDYKINVTNNYATNYIDNRLILDSNDLGISIYKVQESYQEIISHIDELKLKWEEFGIKITSNQEKEANLYEMRGSYHNLEHVFYVVKKDNVLIVEVQIKHNDFDHYEKEVLAILDSITKNTISIDHDFSNLTFDLDPIGSQ